MTAQQTTAQRIALRRRAIFAACKAAGLDEGARRAIVLELTGCTSMSQCTLTQLGDVLDRLNRSKTGYAGRRRSTPTEDGPRSTRSPTKITRRPRGCSASTARPCSSRATA